MTTANPMIAPLIEMLKPLVASTNEIAGKIRQATSADKDVLNDILNTSDDPLIVEWKGERAKIEAGIAKLREKMSAGDAKVKEHARSLVGGEDFSIEDSRAEYLEGRKQVTLLKKTILGFMGNDEEALKAALDSAGISEVIGLTRAATVTGPAGRKPRISDASVDGESALDQAGKVSFTTLAKKIGADVSDLRDAAFKAAGTDDFRTIPGKVVEFTFANGDKTHQVSVTAKEKATDEKTSDSE